jgi:hypothetical protein
MAGMDASANLGGMLSQIGGTLGSMGQAGQGLMQPIMTSFRPQLDPNSVESLQRQAAFQGRIGDTEQARLFTGQALALEERNREEAEKQRKLEEGQAQAKAVNAYANALASEDEAAIEAAQAEAMSVGYAQGVNMMPVLSQAEGRFYDKKNQVYQEGERARVNKKRAEDAAVEKATQAMAAAFNKARTEEQLNGLLQSAGPLVAEQASILYRNNVARLEADRARAEREAEADAPIESIDTALIPSGDAIPPETLASLRKQTEAYNERVQAANNTVAGKGFLPQTTRNSLKNERTAILSRLYDTIDKVDLYDYRVEQGRQKAEQTEITRILNDSFNKPERDAAKVVDWGRDLTELQAIRLLRNEALKSYLGAERAAEYVQYREGDPKIVLAGLPKPGDKKPSISTEDVTVESTAPVTNRAEERNAREEALLAERRNIIGGERKRRRMPETQQRLAEINAELESLTSGLSMPQATFYSGALANDPFLQQLGTQSNLGMGPANFYSNAMVNDPALNPQIRGRGQRRQ